MQVRPRYRLSTTAVACLKPMRAWHSNVTPRLRYVKHPTFSPSTRWVFVARPWLLSLPWRKWSSKRGLPTKRLARLSLSPAHNSPDKSLAHALWGATSLSKISFITSLLGASFSNPTPQNSTTSSPPSSVSPLYIPILPLRFAATEPRCSTCHQWFLNSV